MLSAETRFVCPFTRGERLNNSVFGRPRRTTVDVAELYISFVEATQIKLFTQMEGRGIRNEHMQNNALKTPR